jgi:hypothetical protein
MGMRVREMRERRGGRMTGMWRGAKGGGREGEGRWG